MSINPLHVISAVCRFLFICLLGYMPVFVLFSQKNKGTCCSCNVWLANLQIFIQGVIRTEQEINYKRQKLSASSCEQTVPLVLAIFSFTPMRQRLNKTLLKDKNITEAIKPLISHSGIMMVSINNPNEANLIPLIFSRDLRGRDRVVATCNQCLSPLTL